MEDQLEFDNKTLQEAVRIIRERPENVRPWEAAEIVACVFDAAELSACSDGGEMLKRAFSNKCVQEQGYAEPFVAALPPKCIAEILLQVDTGGLEDEPVNKHLGVEIADYIGPDWAQAWYHFAVFMTRVA